MTRLPVLYISLIAISLMFTIQSFAEIDLEAAVGIWLFDEGKGDTVTDLSENGNEGTLNGPEWVDGKFGKALSFDGKDDAIEIPDSDSINDVDDLTMLAWVYLRRAVTSGSWNALFGKKPYASGYLMWIEVPREPCGLVYSPGRSDCRAGVQLDLEKWYHLAFTRVNKGEMKFYIDGEEVKVAASTPGVIKTSPAPISIGGQSPQVIDGMIDDVAIFNVALAEDDIKSLADKGIDRTLSITAASGKLTTTWGLIKSLQ
ncbi:LamG domain-containing protein [bacterium]|nr:LamG domain-containing protein [bacterium]